MERKTHPTKLNLIAEGVMRYAVPPYG